MKEKSLIGLIRGIVASSCKTNIVIIPDDPRKKNITEARDRDYSEYHVGQRVVWKAYRIRRTPTLEDEEFYIERNMRCPRRITEYEYTIEDEKEYDEKMHGVKEKPKRKLLSKYNY